jgi:cell division protein FtsB
MEVKLITPLDHGVEFDKLDINAKRFLLKEKQDLINTWSDDMKMWVDKTEKLTKENEKLKQFALGVHNFAYGTEWDDTGIVSAMAFGAIIEKMEQDEEDIKIVIKQVNKKVEKDKDKYLKHLQDVMEGFVELKKENKKHVSTIEKNWGMDLVVQNEKLKRENEKLKKENEVLIDGILPDIVEHEADPITGMFD